jgi:hypothetical protein
MTWKVVAKFLDGVSLLVPRSNGTLVDGSLVWGLLLLLLLHVYFLSAPHVACANKTARESLGVGLKKGVRHSQDIM